MPLYCLELCWDNRQFPCGTKTRPQGRGRGRAPGGFSYGDYLGVAPWTVLASDAERVSCAGWRASHRHLQRVSDSVRGRPAAWGVGATARSRRLHVGTDSGWKPPISFTAASIQVNATGSHQTCEGVTWPTSLHSELDDNGQVVFRYVTDAGEADEAATQTGPCITSLLTNAWANVVGLMPHLQHAGSAARRQKMAATFPFAYCTLTIMRRALTGLSQLAQDHGLTAA